MSSSDRPKNLDDFLVEAPLFEQHPPVSCRVRRHLAGRYESTGNVPTTVSEELGTRPSLGLFYYSPVAIIAPNIPMGAIVVEMEGQIDEDASPELEGALACSYLQLATVEMLDYRDDASPVWADTLTPANVHAVSRDDFGIKQWCVG